MKKGFTLVEMLVVVVVLVTLMTIVFRLSSIGDEQEKRNRTIARMQRLENCLSGYYAAFGSYPPVPLHSSRNIYRAVDDTYGGQTSDGNENRSIWSWNSIGEQAETRAWRQVQAACRAQPVDCRFPFSDAMENTVISIAEQLKRKASSGEAHYKGFWDPPETKERLIRSFTSLNSNSGNALANLDINANLSDSHSKAFKFGLMSFLLPRYLFMLGFSSQSSTKLMQCRQWTDNNSEPSNPFNGTHMNWSDVWRNSTSTSNRDLATLANIPSQAVCARWMPNLEGICSVNYTTKFFGISIGDGYVGPLNADNPNIEIFTTGENGSGEPYVLDGITVYDGWWNEFYYYSPPPFQSYVLWSAGPNGRTFPPWIDRKNIENPQQANECIGKWISDDIIHMSN